MHYLCVCVCRNRAWERLLQNLIYSRLSWYFFDSKIINIVVDCFNQTFSLGAFLLCWFFTYVDIDDADDSCFYSYLRCHPYKTTAAITFPAWIVFVQYDLHLISLSLKFLYLTVCSPSGIMRIIYALLLSSLKKLLATSIRPFFFFVFWSRKTKTLCLTLHQ